MTHVRSFAVLAGLIAAAASPIAAAQAVAFEILSTSVPTLSDYGLYLLILLMAASSYWLLRKGHPGHAKGMMVLTLSCGAALLAYDNPPVNVAGAAVGPLTVINLDATANPSNSPIPITTPPAAPVHSITNKTGSPIRITAVTDGGDCSLDPGQQPWQVLEPTGPFASFIPWCNVGSQVAPNALCYVVVVCSGTT